MSYRVRVHANLQLYASMCQIHADFAIVGRTLTTFTTVCSHLLHLRPVSPLCKKAQCPSQPGARARDTHVRA